MFFTGRKHDGENLCEQLRADVLGKISCEEASDPDVRCAVENLPKLLVTLEMIVIVSAPELTKIAIARQLRRSHFRPPHFRTEK